MNDKMVGRLLGEIEGMVSYMISKYNNDALQKKLYPILSIYSKLEHFRLRDLTMEMSDIAHTDFGYKTIDEAIEELYGSEFSYDNLIGGKERHYENAKPRDLITAITALAKELETKYPASNSLSSWWDAYKRNDAMPNKIPAYKELTASVLRKKLLRQKDSKKNNSVSKTESKANKLTTELFESKHGTLVALTVFDAVDSEEPVKQPESVKENVTLPPQPVEEKEEEIIMAAKQTQKTVTANIASTSSSFVNTRTTDLNNAALKAAGQIKNALNYATIMEGYELDFINLSKCINLLMTNNFGSKVLLYMGQKGMSEQDQFLVLFHVFADIRKIICFEDDSNDIAFRSNMTQFIDSLAELSDIRDSKYTFVYKGYGSEIKELLLVPMTRIKMPTKVEKEAV